METLLVVGLIGAAVVALILVLAGGRASRARRREEAEAARLESERLAMGRLAWLTGRAPEAPEVAPPRPLPGRMAPYAITAAPEVSVGGLAATPALARHLRGAPRRGGRRPGDRRRASRHSAARWWRAGRDRDAGACSHRRPGRDHGGSRRHAGAHPGADREPDTATHPRADPCAHARGARHARAHPGAHARSDTDAARHRRSAAARHAPPDPAPNAPSHPAPHAPPHLDSRGRDPAARPDPGGATGTVALAARARRSPAHHPCCLPGRIHANAARQYRAARVPLPTRSGPAESRDFLVNAPPGGQ